MMKEILEKVIDAVKIVGDELLVKDFEVKSKGGYSNIVTTSDVYSQNRLHEMLLKILPESGFFSEEDLNIRKDKYMWVIDPIDGTTNFSRNIECYCISIALLDEGNIVLGVVYNPIQKTTYYAIKGEGAYLDGKKIHVSNRPFANSLYCTSASIYKKELASVCFDIMEEVYLQVNDFRRFGTCSYEICKLADGSCDLYFEVRVFIWDCAASILILNEAGGNISTINFYDIDISTNPFPLLAANTKENYDKLKTIIESHIKEKIY